jgi:superfamily II DNA/RNA helicase
MSSDQLGQSPASLSTDSDPSTSEAAPAPAKRVRKAPVRKPKVEAAAPADAGVIEAAPAVIEPPPVIEPPAVIEAPAAAEPAAAVVVAPPRTRKTLVRKPKVAAGAEPESPQLSLTMAVAPAAAVIESTAANATKSDLLLVESAPAVTPTEAVAAAPAPVEMAAPAAPPLVSAPKQRVTLPHPIIHRVHPVALGRKRDALQYLLAQTPDQPTLIYTRTKHGADKIARHLERCGLKAAAIHGDKSGGARNRALTGFKSGELQALVITDIAARMLDFVGLPRIIGYDLPHIPEDYVQRVLRTGSAEQPGLSLTLITQEESPQYRGVRDLLSQLIDLAPLPGFEAPEPFDPERDPPQRLEAEAADAAPAGPPATSTHAPAGDGRRDGHEGRNRRNRRDRHGRVEQRDRPEGETPPTVTAVSEESAAEPVPRQMREERPPRNERPPRPERPRKEKAEKPEIGNRALPPPKVYHDDEDDDRPGPGNSLAAPPPSQYDTGGFGRRGRRRDPFAPVVIGAEGEFNIYDERQPDDYRDQWSILGPDGGRPSWTYAQEGNTEEAPRRQFQGPPQGRRSPGGGGGGGGGGSSRGPHRGPQQGQGRGGQQRHNRPRRADGR